MKKTKFFMAAGALALAISAIFATKANKKFTGTVVTASFASGYFLYWPTGTLMTVTQGSHSQMAVTIHTASGNTLGLNGDVITAPSGVSLNNTAVFYN